MADKQNNFKKQKAKYIETVLNICWTCLNAFRYATLAKKSYEAMPSPENDREAD